MKRAILLAACLATSALSAQQTDSLSLPHPEYMERAYIFKNIPDSKTGELFQGLIPLHLPLRQDVQSAYNSVRRDPWHSHSSLAAFFSMVVELRMTKENSAPVRTPSYMPKITLTYFNVKALARLDTAVRTRADSLRFMKLNQVRLWTIPVIPYGHYSNGQDGCLFTFQQELNKVCTDTAKAPHGLTVNRRDGSFSSHYMQVGVFYRRITLDDETQLGPYYVGKSYWSLGGQVRAYQPYYWLGGGLSEELRALYGPTRIRALANHVTQHSSGRFFGPGQFRVEGFVEALAGTRHSSVDPVRVSIEVARTMDKRGGWGLFARVYSGQDDYNLGFLTNIRVLQIGATATAERMPSFRR
jgi:hypothetical protein